MRHLLALGAPNDPDYSQQWALSRIDAGGGWSLFPGTFTPVTGAPIGIVDTGVDGSHGDLAGRLSASAVCSGGCAAGAPTDPVGHGTSAGIAGAATNNAVGVSGLAFSSPLMAVRVFHNDATYGWIAEDSDVADGIAWAAQHGAG